MISKRIHDVFIYDHRMKRLSELIKPFLIDCKNLLDVGTGDGKIAFFLTKSLGVDVCGIDVKVRENHFIDVKRYDGNNIPFSDDSFETVMAIDVLHHAENPGRVFHEMCRVTSNKIIIKDHIRSNIISYFKLRLMDYIGNSHYGVSLPYNYFTIKQWEKLFSQNDLTVKYFSTNLYLYDGIFHYLFDNNLHFIVCLEKRKDMNGEQ